MIFQLRKIGKMEKMTVKLLIYIFKTARRCFHLLLNPKDRFHDESAVFGGTSNEQPFYDTLIGRYEGCSLATSRPQPGLSPFE